MGSTQSSHAATDDNMMLSPSTKKGGSSSVMNSVRGRKSSILKSVPPGLRASVVSMPSDHFGRSGDLGEDLDATHTETYHDDDEDDDALEFELGDRLETDSDYDSDEDEDEEDDEDWEERNRILEEARQLKQAAQYFLHPEAPVPASLPARCFFDRPSAPERLTKQEADELAAILEDASALKKYAVAYSHPESPVVSDDSTAFARNYFGRASAPEQVSVEDAEEREASMEDLKALKESAVHFFHPEHPVSACSAGGRNYFSRPSAPRYETEEEAQDRAAILADVAALKAQAVNYLHPELPLKVDPTSFGRNYYTRASAPEHERENMADEREHVLRDLLMLKEAAVNFLHPEIPVKTTDPTVYGRNYFSRYSATEYDTTEEATERSCILADASVLKQKAVDFMHPEVTVEITDHTIFGRNYFSRPSGSVYETEQDADLRAQVIADSKAFKKMATDYMHPEREINTDPIATGRNFFSRFSAPAYESLEDAEARARVMDDIKVFKKLAIDFLHPELPAKSAHSAAFGRNYFHRASAPTSENADEAEERAAILADLKALKESAVHFLHPELPVCTTDPTVFGRNYFNRASAPTQETLSERDDRNSVLADVKALKANAIQFLHPELPVAVTDPFACGRNYFSRPSAPETVTNEEAEERTRIMKDLKLLKQAAVDFMHPELPVVANDYTLFARNFFGRASAPEQELPAAADERSSIMNDLKLLKLSAINYFHPENPVVSEDPTTFARCYFTRPSAPEQVSEEEAQDREASLVDIASLKESAKAYMHPELSVNTTDPTAKGRNYYDRGSNDVHYQMIHTFPAHEDDCTTHHDEHMDHFGMDEEMEGMFNDLRHDLDPPHNSGYNSNNFYKLGDEEGGGNLSRSPSSVMLFSGEDA